MVKLSLVLFVVAMCSTVASAQDFVVKWVDNTRPDSQISVDTGTGTWEDYSETGGSGTVQVDGSDLFLFDGVNIVAVLKKAAGAKIGATGTAEDGGTPPSTIGDWECGEF